MSAAEDHFIAGEGPLAALIRAQPAQPPSSPAPMSAPTESLAKSTADTPNAADATHEGLALAAKPQGVARLAAMAELSRSTANRTRQNLAQENVAMRAAPLAAPPATLMAGAAPAAEPTTPTPALRSEADAAATISASLDTTITTLADKLLTRSAPAWTMTVAATDETTGRTLHLTLEAYLQALGRSETVELSIGEVPAGEVRLAPSTNPARTLQWAP